MKMSQSKALLTTFIALIISSAAQASINVQADAGINASAHHKSSNFMKTEINSPEVNNTQASTIKIPEIILSEPVSEKVINISIKSSSGLESKAAEDANPQPKLIDYMKPICFALEHITAKQLFKVQSQLKQFVELTNAKLSQCFMQQYGLDPALKPVTKQDLGVICRSNQTIATDQSSFKAFEACAAKNWDPEVDKLLDKIFEARLDHSRNHNYSSLKNNSSTALLHDDDEGKDLLGSVIKGVVNDASDNSTLRANRSIEIDDASSSKIVASTDGSSTEVVIEKPPVNETSSNKLVTTIHRSEGHLNQTKSEIPQPISGLSNHTIEAGLILRNSSSKALKTAVDNAISLVNKATDSISNSSHLISKTAHPSIRHTNSTTIKPNSSIVYTKKEVVKAIVKTTVAPENSNTVSQTTAKASKLGQFESFEDILRRQEKQKAEFEYKLKLERERALKQVRGDDLIKKLGFKSLLSDQPRDKTLHQLEHDRQMMIDPIGHSIKHEQYEITKQKMRVTTSMTK